MEDQADVLDNDPLADETDDPVELNGDTAENTTKGATVIYDGECRSDNRDTISDNGEVNSSYRTLALPLKQDEWTEETIPMEGDKIELKRFGYKEYGRVIDKRPSNLGTHILWKYVRN
jgi:hypothetical protein